MPSSARTITTPLLPGVKLRAVSPAYAKVAAIATALWVAVPVIAAVVCAMIWGSTLRWLIFVAMAVVLAALWLVYLAARRARMIGYHEAEGELMVCRGILVRRVDIVPYVRMQEVTVESGPLLRAHGLATVTMETASVQTNTAIPGLPSEEAKRLRIKLTSLEQSQLEGL